MKKSIEQIEYFEKFGSILGLERIENLLDKMNNPQEELKCIHIAGTNGKGSTSRFIYSALLEAGYSVGIYSSPFLEIFNERIEVDGKYISDEDVERLIDFVVKKAKEVEAEGRPTPTEFDIVTAVAFQYFKEKKVDYVILEVGLGGRGDSTNIIKKPLLCAITSISLDHTDRLGESLEEIAMEKAGIIKDNGHLICGYLPKEAIKVIREKCQLMNAILEFSYPQLDGRNEGIEIEIKEENIYGNSFTLTKEKLNFKTTMAGRHQIDNCILAYGILKYLEKLGVNLGEQAYLKGFEKAFNKGRLEILSYKDKEFILDGAHNEDGMKAFVETLKLHFKDKKMALVMGILEDKDQKAMMKQLMKLTEELDIDFVATQPDNPRKLGFSQLGTILKNSQLNVIYEGYIDDIIYGNILDDYNTVAFVGSLYLVGQVRSILMKGSV